MKTEWKDVAHLYPKCELKTDSGNLILEGIRHDCIYGGEPDAYVMNGNVTHKMNWEDFKPILRPLSDMTTEEMKELLIFWYHPNGDIFLSQINEFKFHIDEPKRHIKHGEGVGFSLLKGGNNYMHGTLSYKSLNPYQFQFLLSKSFDLFGLIESGQAIDKTTLTNHPKLNGGK